MRAAKGCQCCTTPAREQHRCKNSTGWAQRAHARTHICCTPSRRRARGPREEGGREGWWRGRVASAAKGRLEGHNPALISRRAVPATAPCARAAPPPAAPAQRGAWREAPRVSSMPPQRSIASFFQGGAASAVARRPLPLPPAPAPEAPYAAPRELPAADAEADTRAGLPLPARADDDGDGDSAQAVCEAAQAEAVTNSPPPLRVFSRKRRPTSAPDGCARDAALLRCASRRLRTATLTLPPFSHRHVSRMQRAATARACRRRWSRRLRARGGAVRRSGRARSRVRAARSAPQVQAAVLGPGSG